MLGCDILKDYYKINEISKIYDIGKDSLRYYEKIGILNPKRDENGYRMYSLIDITTLNIIKELRGLGFGMQKIKEFLHNRNVNSTLSILEIEIDAINNRIFELENLKINISNRKANILKESSEQFFGEIKELFISERSCIHLNEAILREEEVDLMIRKLQDKYSKNLYILGNSMIGATVNVDIDELNNKAIQFENALKFSKYNSVFFVVDKKEEYDFIIPSRNYLCVKYRGNYNQTNYYILKITEYAKAHRYEIIDYPLEIYHIDIHETSIIDEFITEIQIAVSKKGAE